MPRLFKYKRIVLCDKAVFICAFFILSSNVCNVATAATLDNEWTGHVMKSFHNEPSHLSTSDVNEKLPELQNAVRTLQMYRGGIEVCLSNSNENSRNSEWFPDLVTCDRLPRWNRDTKDETSLSTRSLSSHPSWWEESSEEIINGFGAFICISIAALAAGLTLGMLGLDPLMLLVKQRASSDPVEREQATNLLPVVKKHHRLLVTLLLMNAVANEALPIFLEALVPPSLAVVFSVLFVLFFGEIIPSAIFTGPNKMKIASNLIPVVKTAMFLLYPVAMPISMLLDRLLHDDDNDGGGNSYQRGELSALIRIQYEERIASKRKRKQERKQHLHSPNVQLLTDDDHIGSLDFPTRKSFRDEQRQSLRAMKSQIEYADSRDSLLTDNTTSGSTGEMKDSSERRLLVLSLPRNGPSTRNPYEEIGLQRSNSIHIDEVTMVEGALSMNVKVALDVYTPLRSVYSIPDTTVLSEKGIVKIYASGFSRIPVYNVDASNKNNKKHIIGVLMTKQLIVVNPDDKRLVTSMPLYTPLCVSPQTSLIDLVNLFQTGGKGMTGGHLALVCASPRDGNEALTAGHPLPEEAGLMGVITFEDVLEALLQEQIFDENDKYERDALKLARMVWHRWRRFVEGKKSLRFKKHPDMRRVVDDAVAAHTMEQGLADERTSLVSGMENQF